jgi:outer membrane biosynthesis protein TonB
MEKINALIDKLQELKNSNADLQTISYYAQLLQAEVLHARTLQRQERQTQSTIAVIMPARPAQTVTVAASANGTHYNGHTNNGADTATLAPEKRSTPAPEPVQPVQPAPPPPAPVEAVKPVPMPESRPYEPKPAPVPPPPPVEAVKPIPAPAPAPVPERKPVAATLFDVEKPAAPAPKPKENGNSLRKELNELVAQNGTSLNDKLKQSKSEVADRLNEIPVKDLKQAIGINDKFQFIQELFRGDVDMYERSIKTINECHSLQEAEYWIERELKIRQGWLDDTRPVQHFYSLVKKRFS